MTLPDGAALPVWIGAVYFGGILAAGKALSWFEAGDRGLVPPSGRTFGVELFCFVALYLAPPLLHNHEVLLTVLAAAFLAIRLCFFRAPGDLTVALVVITMDFAVESALAAAGLFEYPNADFIHLPLWLAPLWGGLGLGLRRLFGTALKPNCVRRGFHRPS